MFFKKYLIFIFQKFFYAGLLFGIAKIFFKAIDKMFKHNIFVYNLLSFIYVLSFGMIFAFLSMKLYNLRFCWFGLLGMFLGLILVDFSLQILFTNLFLLLYNKVTKVKTRNRNGELQRSKES